MSEYIYTTRANCGGEWLKSMLDDWKKTKKKYLCFPWIEFQVHTIRDQSFWLYMYYSLKETDISELKGVIEYRLYIKDWSSSIYSGNDIYTARESEAGTVWFLADKFEEIRKLDKTFLRLNDFRHADDKRLGSTLRNSIPPVVLLSKLSVLECYPEI